MINHIEDCSSVDLDYPHNLDQEVEYCILTFLFSCMKIIEVLIDAL